MRLVCWSIASATTAGDGGIGIEPAMIEARFESSWPGVLTSAEIELPASVSLLFRISILLLAYSNVELTRPHPLASASFSSQSCAPLLALLYHHRLTSQYPRLSQLCA